MFSHELHHDNPRVIFKIITRQADFLQVLYKRRMTFSLTPLSLFQELCEKQHLFHESSPGRISASKKQAARAAPGVYKAVWTRAATAAFCRDLRAQILTDGAGAALRGGLCHGVSSMAWRDLTRTP